MVLTGMYHSCFLSSLCTCVFNVLWRTNESRYQLAISIVKFPGDVRLILLKSRFDACLEFQVTMLSKLDLKRACKKYWFSKKKVFHQLDSNPQPSQLLYPLSYMAVVFNRMFLDFSPVLLLQPTAECKLITALTHGDKLEVGGWWVYGVRQLIWRCRQSQVR